MRRPQRRGRGGPAGRFFLLVACSTLGACAYLPPGFTPLAPPAAPALAALDTGTCRRLLHDDAAVDSLREAAARSRTYLAGLPPDQTLPVPGRTVRAGDLTRVIDTVTDLTGASDWPGAMCDHLRLYRVALPPAADDAGRGGTDLLVTGYYQPELDASRTRTERFRYPIHRTPDDLVDVPLAAFCPACGGRIAEGRVQNGTLVSYYSRAEIEAGALAGKGYELAWLDDPVEAFFLHIQGSALLRFSDGVHMEIAYSASNGRPYTSIGRQLIEQGRLAPEQMSLQALKDYLRTHPDEQGTLMAADQRYIFFRTVAAGPIGSLGVPLTPGRSLAADPGVYPPGALAFLRIRPRTDAPAAAAPLRVSRLAFIQDRGAAIVGARRLDVFWGTGATAGALAGELRNPGELYLLLPR